MIDVSSEDTWPGAQIRQVQVKSVHVEPKDGEQQPKATYSQEQEDQDPERWDGMS